MEWNWGSNPDRSETQVPMTTSVQIWYGCSYLCYSSLLWELTSTHLKLLVFLKTRTSQKCLAIFKDSYFPVTLAILTNHNHTLTESPVNRQLLQELNTLIMWQTLVICSHSFFLFQIAHIWLTWLFWSPLKCLNKWVYTEMSSWHTSYHTFANFTQCVLLSQPLPQVIHLSPVCMQTFASLCGWNINCWMISSRSVAIWDCRVWP